MKRSDFIQHLWNMAAFYYVKEQSIRFGRTKQIANELQFHDIVNWLISP